MELGGSFWDWSEELDLLRRAVRESAHSGLNAGSELDPLEFRNKGVQFPCEAAPPPVLHDPISLDLVDCEELPASEELVLAPSCDRRNDDLQMGGCDISQSAGVGNGRESLTRGRDPDVEEAGCCDQSGKERVEDGASEVCRSEGRETTPCPARIYSSEGQEPVLFLEGESSTVLQDSELVQESSSDGSCWEIAEDACSQDGVADASARSGSPEADVDDVSADLSIIPGGSSPAATALERAPLEAVAQSHSFPFLLPLVIPLHLAGLVARPLLSIRHVPGKALLMLRSAKTPKSNHKRGMIRGSDAAGLQSVPPFVQDRRGRVLLKGKSSFKETSSGRRHFTKSHQLLDLTAPDWLWDEKLSVRCEYSSLGAEPAHIGAVVGGTSGVLQDWGIDQSDGCQPTQATVSAALDQCRLYVSADASADSDSEELPPEAAQRFGPSNLEIKNQSPLAGVHNPGWEPDSFSITYSPSSLSLDGSFRYGETEGAAEASPMSSRSCSTANLEGGNLHSDASSSTDESESYLYLPSNQLLLTPPETPPPAALESREEVSKPFVIPEGVTDPAELEELEQQWAQRIRARRKEHGDQHYMKAAELMAPPWDKLVFWHGADKKGHPVLYCRLGLAVRTLPRHLQERMGCALYSMVELAENSLWRPECGWGYQRMTVLVDAEGLGITRMAPVESLKHGFKLIHRDYPARQGYTYIINVPPLLNMMIGVFKRVIGVDDRAASERLGVFGRNFRSHLQKDFEPEMLHRDFGGCCTCSACCSGGEVGVRKSGKRLLRPEDWVLDSVPAYQR